MRFTRVQRAGAEGDVMFKPVRSIDLALVLAAAFTWACGTRAADCCDAIDVIAVPGGVTGHTQPPAHADRWYRYVPTTGGTLTLEFTDDPQDNHTYSVMLGCLCHGRTASQEIVLVELTSDPQTLPVYRGLVYYIRVRGVYPPSSYTLALTGPAGGGVQNPWSALSCYQAFRLHPGAVSGNGDFVYDDLWYEYLPQHNGALTLNFIYNEDINGWQTRFSVLSACSGGNYIVQDVETQASFPVYAGVSYKIRMNATGFNPEMTYILGIDGPPAYDECPLDPWKSYPGQCGCGVWDSDDDDDGVADCVDVCPGFDDTLDCNNNGNPDGCDIRDGLSADCNDNGIPDDCDPDSDGDGIPDDCDYTLGDLNCDGAFDFGDINPFVTALLAPSQYATEYPTCNLLNGDFSADGFVDFADINPFVRALLGYPPH